MGLQVVLPSPRGPEISNQGEPEVVGTGERQACQALLEAGPVAQVVLSRPATNELIVDEQAWFALPDNSRCLLVSTARCAALRADVDYGVVYGAKTRRRLALANSEGVILD